MFKRILSVILAFTVAISLTSCTSEVEYVPGSGTANGVAGDYEYERIEDYIKIVKYVGQDTDVVIPEKIGGIAVCIIGEKAFESRASLLSVHIPETVQIIEKNAFSRCYYLKKVTGCKGLVSIADEAFAYDERLEEFPWEEKLQMIGEKSFVWCESLKVVNIVSSCDYIGNYAFRNCEKIAEINFTDELVSIGKEAFMATGISKLRYPYATNGIGEGAFKHNNSLKEITFDERVTIIASKAFQNSRGLQEVVIPSHITLMGQIAFGSCMAIEKITFENPELDYDEYPLLLVTDFTVYGHVGSTAEHYVQGCSENRNIRFEVIS